MSNKNKEQNLPRLFGTIPTRLSNKNPNIARWDASQPIIRGDLTNGQVGAKDPQAQFVGIQDGSLHIRYFHANFWTEDYE